MSPPPNPPPTPYVRDSYKQPLYMVTRPHTGKTLQCAWTLPGLQADFCKARSSYFLFITHFEGAVVIYKTIGFFLFPTYRCLTLIIFRTSASLCREHHGDILKATVSVLNYRVGGKRVKHYLSSQGTLFWKQNIPFSYNAFILCAQTVIV